MSKKLCFRKHLDRQHGKWVEQCHNLNDSTFPIFMNHCEVIALEKISFSDRQNPNVVS